MLTKFSEDSSLKTKFTVVVIWLMALIMSYGVIQFVIHSALSIWLLILPIILATFVIAGILLRCKIARWFTLLGVYIFIFFPFSVLFIPQQDGVVDSEMLITRIVTYLFLGLIAIYTLSNEKAMDIFYIKSNPKEHLIFIALSFAILTMLFYFIW